jgi:hypothetical protein
MASADEGAKVLNGGLVTGMPPHAVGNTESPDCENIDPSWPLGTRTRRGSSVYGVTLVTGGSGSFISGLRVWTRDNGTTYIVFANKTSIYSADGTTAVSINAAMSSDSVMQAGALNNQLVVVASGLYPQISSAGSTLASITAGTYLPALAKYCAEYGAKIWIAGDPLNPSRVSFSKSNDPQDWATAANAGNADIGTGDGDVIKGLSGTRRALYVFKRANTYVITGNSTANYQADQLCAWGIVGDYAHANDGQGTFFASDDGIYYAVGLNCGRISDAVKGTYDSITDKSTIAMEVKGDKLFIFYKPAGATANTRALVCAYKRKMSDGGVRGVWSSYSSQPYSVANTSRTSQLYAGTNASTLQIYELDTGSPGAVTAYWNTPDYDFESYAPKVAIRYFVHMAADTATTTMTVRHFADGASVGTDSTLTFGTSGSHGVQQQAAQNPFQGHYLRLKMSWTGDKTLYGVRVWADIRAEGMPRR